MRDAKAAPRIGVTSALRSSARDDAPGGEVRNHVRLLESFGAETVVLVRGPATAHALERYELDGVLFSGGGDVAASFYGGRADLCWGKPDAQRDEGEFALVRAALARRVPTLCVCRGLQVANVAFGGTLVEDVKNELGSKYGIRHHQVRELGKQPWERTHDVRFVQDSALAAILGTQALSTNSVHHQAIRDVAAPLRAVGWTADGIIEAIELAAPGFFFCGVQWHPESLPEDEASIRLYTSFIEAAARYRSPSASRSL